MSTPEPSSLVALLHGPDKPGLVARVAGYIFDEGGNIIHADQHRDQEAEVFFQRVEWSHPSAELTTEAERFRDFARILGLTEVRVAISTEPTRCALFVTKADHCLYDLLLRWKSGELPVNFVAVVSNHTTLQPVAEQYGIPFHHVPVTPETKVEAEERHLELLAETQADLGVLARYMQILSAHFIERSPCPFINIHHSFLPAFKGARPYHQAHSRGVKLIGATAHYVTADLDQGPIIHQDVARVTHRNDVGDLVRKGRDLEKLVLSTAVRWHVEHRVLTFNNKTVVFD